jgi:hypothetical protein
MNLATKSVARRVASPRGTPNRKKSFAFISFDPNLLVNWPESELHLPLS